MPILLPCSLRGRLLRQGIDGKGSRIGKAESACDTNVTDEWFQIRGHRDREAIRIEVPRGYPRVAEVKALRRFDFLPGKFHFNCASRFPSRRKNREESRHRQLGKGAKGHETTE